MTIGIFVTCKEHFLSIEKAFRAYYTSLNQEVAPYSPSLSYLTKKGGFYKAFPDEKKVFIDQIEPLNMETRYPFHKDHLLKSLTHHKCTELIEKTQQIQQWIKARL